MAGLGRSLEQWNALTRGNQRRWIRAFGNNEDAAVAAYLDGAKLTTAQRGHAHTPERPERALRAPQRYPRYVGTHTAELNEIARQRGTQQYGRGPRGESELTQSYEEAGGDFTWVVPAGTLTPPTWHFSQVFRTVTEAQLFARRSNAPAGVVQIQDLGPGAAWRYEVWFGYPDGITKPRRPTKPKAPVKTRRLANYEKQNKGRHLTPAQKKRLRKNANKKR